MSDNASISTQSLFEGPSKIRFRQWRMFKDAVAAKGVALGGISVIIAIILIFFYLLYVVIPLFKPASIEKVADYAKPDNQVSLHLAMEEQGEIAMRVAGNAEITFFEAADGEVVDHVVPPLPDGATVTSFNTGDPSMARLAFGLNNGQAVVVGHEYKVTYPQDVRLITPQVTYPLGEAALTIDSEGQALSLIAFQDGEDSATFVAYTADGRLLLTSFTKEESFLTGEVTLEQTQTELPAPENPLQYLLMDLDQRHLYTISQDGWLTHFGITDKEDPEQLERLRLVDVDRKITAVRFLAGDISLLVGDDTGTVTQWFSVRDSLGNEELTRIRAFKSGSSQIVDIIPEYNRKEFLVIDAQGDVEIFHTTAHRHVLSEHVSAEPIEQLAINPRSKVMLFEDASGQLHFWSIDNEHPEISWLSIWNEVWYESYNEPTYAWQSSSASNIFEPKLSLTPLVFGTIKAAFYAMLLAVPLAILGAIYTAYFMSPEMRRIVKPSIETMEALPTVILGFLAGLWLAPFVESNLPGIFTLLIILPVGVLVFAFLWHKSPPVIRHSIPEGWTAALLIPVVIILAWIAFALSTPMELAFFNGDMPNWLSNELGIGFDQRNSIIVGLAMGFAVIPTIFSITEDAIFSVPKHLTNGSLALGATTWQTLSKVVILTASPGIFSAVMIGLGRAVGETMIVLMATGNTPVMDFSIFQGMRTLSANIAVEMPESEVDSTHYRVLFLAALVLFIFTFVFNTGAELIRQRLRTKYSSL